MKRITISLDDEILESLTQCAKDKSKEDLTRSSVSRVVRAFLARDLAELGYYPFANNEEERENPKMPTRENEAYFLSVGEKGRNHIATCKSNLSQSVINDYLSSLKALGFAKQAVDNERIYRLTNIGYQILEQFLEVKD